MSCYRSQCIWSASGLLALTGIILIPSVRAESVYNYSYYCTYQYLSFDSGTCVISGEKCVPAQNNPCIEGKQLEEIWHPGVCMGPALTACITNVTYNRETLLFLCNCIFDDDECGCFCSEQGQKQIKVVGCATAN